MDIAKKYTDTFLSNSYAMAIVKLLLVSYIAVIAPTPPSYVSTLFKNPIFKIVALATIAYISNIDFSVSIILAIVFVLGMNLLAGRGMLESFLPSPQPGIFDRVNQEWESDSTKVTTLLGTPTILKNTPIESTTDNYPGCMGIKMSDLLSIFGNTAKIQEKLDYSYKDLASKITDTDAQIRLERTARAAGLNSNVPFTDANAPYIATILLNKGYEITDTCRAPN